MNDIFFDKLDNVITSRGLKQKELAEMLGVSPAHINRLIKRSCSPSPQLVLALDRIIEDHHRNTLPAVLVPVYSTVPAGYAETPIVVEEEPLDYVACPGNAANKGALLVTGHSMTPEINEGEFVIYERGAGIETQRYRMQLIEGYFGFYCLNTINPVLIEKYKTHRLQTVTPSTVNKELSVLSQILKWALDLNMIDQLPRIKRFPPKLTTAAPPVIPAHSELQKVLEAVPAATRGMYLLMFRYGLRSAEARHLQTKDIHHDRRLISVTGKGNKTRIVPIVDDETWAILQHQAEQATNGYLWWSKRSNGPYKSLRDGLKRAAKRAGVDTRMYCHLLRHACATELVGIADVKTVGALLGHTSSAVTDRYLHLRQDRLANALKQLMVENTGQVMSQK